MGTNQTAKAIPLRKHSQQLIDALATRILVLDGATGTALQSMDLKASDFGGEALEGCNENLVLVSPHIVEEVHNRYLQIWLRYCRDQYVWSHRHRPRRIRALGSCL